ncbi:hypothetical protein M514_11746 [Trichuris suis]|uniref:Uncharacterized protein n=1 Tax=Trichuris suis TaxID=68888 RepID=A0A085MVY3_9BILA|nr:hypothetical protein M514_11746 [Trichuris suis]
MYEDESLALQVFHYWSLTGSYGLLRREQTIMSTPYFNEYITLLNGTILEYMSMYPEVQCDMPELGPKCKYEIHRMVHTHPLHTWSCPELSEFIRSSSPQLPRLVCERRVHQRMCYIRST